MVDNTKQSRYNTAPREPYSHIINTMTLRLFFLSNVFVYKQENQQQNIRRCVKFCELQVIVQPYSMQQFT